MLTVLSHYTSNFILFGHDVMKICLCIRFVSQWAQSQQQSGTMYNASD